MLLAVRISSYGCTWEVWRALKKLELLSAAPPATLTLLSCSPNFPRASITRYTHAKHEPILKYLRCNQSMLRLENHSAKLLFLSFTHRVICEWCEFGVLILALFTSRVVYHVKRPVTLQLSNSANCHVSCFNFKQEINNLYVVCPSA